MLEKVITESEIKAMSLKFVKERFGFYNLKAAEGSGIDMADHRISFEAAVKMMLTKMGYVKENKKYILNEGKKDLHNNPIKIK
jgi:hypothetical protein